MSEQPSLRERVAMSDLAYRVADAIEQHSIGVGSARASCRCGFDVMDQPGTDYYAVAHKHRAEAVVAAISAHITEGLDEAVDAFRRRIEAEAEPGVEFVEAWAREDVLLAVHTLGLLPSPEQEQSQ